ncbi:hypothetical protein HanRHA438_Chr16g0744391 [Helianthus annuus]|nr:hypothetical protein HanRHA438_Chr16g0744391 [Helianthus annuus]
MAQWSTAWSRLGREERVYCGIWPCRQIRVMIWRITGTCLVPRCKRRNRRSRRQCRLRFIIV